MTDVLFLVRSLGIGGAERQLVLLARGLSRQGHSVAIAQFYAGGALAEGLQHEGITVYHLEKQGRWDVLAFLLRLRRLLRATRPKVIHGYLPVPNLLTLTVRFWSPQTRVVWGVRDAGVERGFYDRLSHLSFWCTRKLARYADRIVVNSEAGRKRHQELGYPPQKLTVVPNGIDTVHFHPTDEPATLLRHRLGLPATGPLIGCVARMDRLKGIDILLDAMAQARSRGWNGSLVVVGGGNSDVARRLAQQANSLGLAEVVHWRESESDLPAFYSALDALCLTSRSEGFPNVIAEAMACGTRCIATDVGDVLQVMGGLGAVIPAGDVAACADALASVREHTSPDLATRCRRHITENFSVPVMLMRTEQLLFATGPQ